MCVCVCVRVYGFGRVVVRVCMCEWLCVCVCVCVCVYGWVYILASQLHTATVMAASRRGGGCEVADPQLAVCVCSCVRITAALLFLIRYFYSSVATNSVKNISNYLWYMYLNVYRRSNNYLIRQGSRPVRLYF